MTPQYILGDVISGAIISGKAKANAEWMLQMMQKLGHTQVIFYADSVKKTTDDLNRMGFKT